MAVVVAVTNRRRGTMVMIIARIGTGFCGDMMNSWDGSTSTPGSLFARDLGGRQ
jgi:hypothetical protein